MAIAIKAYYDGSGKPRDINANYLTLAGYIGTPGAWQNFEKLWDTVLQRWGCPYLHMKHVYTLQGEFSENKGWTRERTLGLLQDLFNECLSPIGWGEEFKGKFRGTSCTINLKDYARAKANKPSLKSPEAICIDHVVPVALAMLPDNPNHQPFRKDGTAELIFDKGEPFLDSIQPTWRLKPYNKHSGILQLVSSIISSEMKDTIGLQAADFLAWHTNRYYTHGFMEKTGSLAQMMRIGSTPLSDCYCDYDFLMELKYL